MKGNISEIYLGFVAVGFTTISVQVTPPSKKPKAGLIRKKNIGYNHLGQSW